jgi:hypothetical protein
MCDSWRGYRCFDVVNHRWKTITSWNGTPATVELFGFDAKVSELIEAGWTFKVVFNNLTKSTKLIGKFQNDVYHVSGPMLIAFPDHVILEVINIGKKWATFFRGEKFSLYNAETKKEETVSLNQLSVSDLLDAITERLKQETPVLRGKPKEPSDNVIELMNFIKHAA